MWTISRLVCTETGPERRDDTATWEVREVFRLVAALLHLKTGTRSGVCLQNAPHPANCSPISVPGQTLSSRLDRPPYVYPLRSISEASVEPTLSLCSPFCHWPPVFPSVSWLPGNIQRAAFRNVSNVFAHRLEYTERLHGRG